MQSSNAVSRWTKTKRKLVAAIPAVVIFGTAPQYFVMWSTWRLLSLLCPNWFYQFGDDFGFSTYQRLILFFFEHCTGVKIYLHGEAAKLVTKREKVLYMSNHQCTMDWMVADMLAVRQGSLGHLRFVMKDSLQMVPLYGHYFYQHGCIFVKRRGFNSKKMINGLNYLRDKNINTWLVIFPEGTRYNPGNTALLEKHRKLAIEQGMKPLQHLLFPRPRGMQIALRHLAGNLDTVYDTTIAYSNTYDSENNIRIESPSFFDFLSRISPEVHIHVRKFAMSDIPYDDDAVFKTWLQNVFVEKDEILGDLLTKRSKGEVVYSRLPLRETAFSVLFFTLSSLPFVCTDTGRRLYWRLWLFGSLASYTWLGIRSIT